MDCRNCTGYKCSNCTKLFPVGTLKPKEEDEDWFIW